MEILPAALIVLSLLTLQAPVQEPNEVGRGPFKPGNGVSAPVLISKTEPMYSEQARIAKYEGTAGLYIQINPSGDPVHIKVIRSLGLGLDQKAMEAVAKWKFRPGSKDGKPVTVEATVEVNFRLLQTWRWAIARSTLAGAAGASGPVLTSVPKPPNCKSSDAKLTLSLTVHADGGVGDVRVVTSSKPSLDHGIVDSVKKWSFDPVMEAGTAKAVSGQIDLVCRSH